MQKKTISSSSVRSSGQGVKPMQLGIQIVGSVSTIAFVVVGMSIVFKLIDLTVGLRIGREEELRGLDIGEHGMEAYGGFQIFSTM